MCKISSMEQNSKLHCMYGLNLDINSFDLALNKEGPRFLETIQPYFKPNFDHTLIVQIFKKNDSLGIS